MSHSAVLSLREMLPLFLRVVLKQLLSKSVATRQQCFTLLRYSAEALDGGLDTEADRICSAAASAIQSADSAIKSSLTLAALSFLAVFFRCHSARCYADHLVDLVPAIVRCMEDKVQRISIEAFTAASALSESVRPEGSTSPLASDFSETIMKMFYATTNALADTNVDGEIREKALETLGSLLVHEGDTLSDSYSIALPLISARLNSENTAATAVQVISKIAQSICKGPGFESWLLEVLPSVVVALRKTKRSAGKSMEFICVQNILARMASMGSALPVTTANGIIAELKPFIETPNALQIVALVLAQQSTCRSTVESLLLPQILEVTRTPSVNPHLVDALSMFFLAYAEGDEDSANRLVHSLVDNLGKGDSLPDATLGGTSSYTTTARCIGVIVNISQKNSASLLSRFIRTIKASKFRQNYNEAD